MLMETQPTQTMLETAKARINERRLRKEITQLTARVVQLNGSVEALQSLMIEQEVELEHKRQHIAMLEANESD